MINTPLTTGRNSGSHILRGFSWLPVPARINNNERPRRERTHHGQRGQLWYLWQSALWQSAAQARTDHHEPGALPSQHNGNPRHHTCGGINIAIQCTLLRGQVAAGRERGALGSPAVAQSGNSPHLQAPQPALSGVSSACCSPDRADDCTTYSSIPAGDVGRVAQTKYQCTVHRPSKS